MWKLLSKLDKDNVKAATQANEALPILTTAGVENYACEGCKFFHNPGGPAGDKGCMPVGIPPDAMPCTYAPKDPGRYFSALPHHAGGVKKALSHLSYSELLILSAMLPAHIQNQSRVANLKLPYKIGQSVTFVYDRAIRSAEILQLDPDFVWVEVDGESVSIPHKMAIPAKK